MMLSLRTPPGAKDRLTGAEGAVWKDVGIALITN